VRGEIRLNCTTSNVKLAPAEHKPNAQAVGSRKTRSSALQGRAQDPPKNSALESQATKNETSELARRARVLTFGPIPPGGKISHELTVTTGNKDELGELKAELVRVEMVGEEDSVVLPRETAGVPPASLLVSVGVTISEDVRHKLPYSAHYPVWIVRSPTYEIWFSQQHGLARTMFDSTGRSIFAYPWGASSGLCRFARVVDGVYRIVHGASEDSRPKSIRWKGKTLVCESQYGDTVEIQCTENHVRWHVKSPTPQLTGPGYRLDVEALHAHPPSFTAMHSDSDQRPADWPDKIGSLSYSVIRQPGYSTDSIWIAATGIVPRCTMFDSKHTHPHRHKGILVHWDWLKSPEFDLYIGVAPDGEVLSRIKCAAGFQYRPISEPTIRFKESSL
jgi:hypothetical protein